LNQYQVKAKGDKIKQRSKHTLLHNRSGNSEGHGKRSGVVTLCTQIAKCLEAGFSLSKNIDGDRKSACNGNAAAILEQKKRSGSKRVGQTTATTNSDERTPVAEMGRTWEFSTRFVRNCPKNHCGYRTLLSR
jgi:hypothetical protein